MDHPDLCASHACAAGCPGLFPAGGTRTCCRHDGSRIRERAEELNSTTHHLAESRWLHGQCRGNRIPCRAQHGELFSICSLTTRAPHATNVPRDSPDPLLPGHLQPTEGRHPDRHNHIHADRAPAAGAGRHPPSSGSGWQLPVRVEQDARPPQGGAQASMFNSPDECIAAVERYIEHHNASDAHPFRWSRSPDDLALSWKRGHRKLQEMASDG